MTHLLVGVGKHAPAGRLTTTWYPKTFIEKRPITDMSLRDNGGITYMHYSGKPVFKFGFGLGYSSFQFSVADEVRLYAPFLTYIRRFVTRA